MDAAGDSGPSLGLDRDTIDLGRRELDRIRARLGSRPPSPMRSDVEPRSPVADTEQVDPTADRMIAEMATAAEHDQLVERVRVLEAEVAHLRSVLAAVIETAASGVRSDR